MKDNDWRTDNWGGAHRWMYDKNYYHAPRTSREAGFYYNPNYVKKISPWTLIVAIAVLSLLLFIL